MARNIRLFIFLTILVTFIIPTGHAVADIGPKPTLEFHFSSLEGQSISPLSGELLGCKDKECLEPQSLENNPYAGLSCQEDTCSGTIFFYSDPLRLKVLFSDNQSRLSNPFAAPAMRNIFAVKVRNADLVITRDVYLSNNAIWGIYLAFIPFTAVGLLIFGGGLLASNLALEHRNLDTQLPFKAARGRYIFAWVLAAIALVGGALLTWALPLTIIIELGVAYIYVRHFWPASRKLLMRHGGRVVTQEDSLINRPPMMPLMTAAATVNLITQPLLWGIAVSLSATLANVFSWQIILMEVGAWLAEALLLRLTQWRHVIWGDAFLLSLFMNLASFLIGLLVSL